MNTDTDNEVARLRELLKNWRQHYRDEASKAQKCKQAFIEQEKEVARLREKLKERIENQNTFAMALIEKPEREVARLRELLNRAIDIADKALDCLIPVFRGEHEELEAELKQLKAEARLAPAPEETDHIVEANEMVHPLMNCQVCGEFRGHGHQCAPAPEELVNDWKCPNCGSTTGTWFSRVEPMGVFCEDCGKAVDEEPDPEWQEVWIWGSDIPSRLVGCPEIATDLYSDEIEALKKNQK
jgi:hypothetical protein